ncbi:uncharacterized protein LOC5512252 isoform X2 [Nematostella vectensis]|uniref:uncharacterized protein LOC5512252 isoform X2 n=1 Tax=Nematostella vectensis TaxID=45351 RepID=UPI00207781AC|nr:uncharacterized protein LOC5512252 isoform X2 [Nematostella vectensis]
MKTPVDVLLYPFTCSMFDKLLKNTVNHYQKNESASAIAENASQGTKSCSISSKTGKRSMTKNAPHFKPSKMQASGKTVLGLLLLSLELTLKNAFVKAMPWPVALYNFSSPNWLEDMSGNGLSAKFYDHAMTEGPTGDKDSAVLFYGTDTSLAEINENIKIDTRYSITSLLWIRQESSGPIFQYDKDSLNGVHFWYRTPTQLYLQIPERGTGKKYGALTYSNLPTKTWHHVGFTYDYSTGLQRLYVNGTMVAESNVGNHEIATIYEIRFAKNLNVILTSSSGYQLRARLNCFQLYDQALNPDQVKAARDMCTRKELFRQCFNYQVLKSFVAAKNYVWYGFKGNKAKKIRSSCPSKSDCQVWINGTHPSRPQGTVEHELCVRGAGGCCEQKARVEIRQCYGYNAYKFKGLPPLDAHIMICLATDTDNDAPEKIFGPMPGYRLINHVIYTETHVPSPTVCIGYCLLDDKRCKSVNYSARDNGICQLNNATEFDGHLSINQTWDYYKPLQFISIV